MGSWIPDYFIKSLRLDARSLLMEQRRVQAAVNARGYSYINPRSPAVPGFLRS